MAPAPPSAPIGETASVIGCSANEARITKPHPAPISIQAARDQTSPAMAFPFSIRVFVRSCMACRFIQNSGLVSKKRASRKAVSAVTDR
jgi:hypothetical protein